MSSFLFLGDLHETTGVLKSDGRDIESVWIARAGYNSHFNVHFLPYITYLDSKCSTQITEFELHMFRKMKGRLFKPFV